MNILKIILILWAFILPPILPCLAVPVNVPRDPITVNGIGPQLQPPSEDLAEVEKNDDPSEEKPLDVPLVLNDSVEAYLDYFKTRKREIFQHWLDRSASYIPMMKDIFRGMNLPEDLVYIAMIESGFNPYAVSWAKAVGVWQFMPRTGKLYGLRIDWWIDERKDPVKSTRAAAEHLKDLHALFGSWPLALASYNAGAHRVRRAVLRTRSEDFWDLKATGYIKPETKNYIPQYMAATIIAKDPEAYGFTVADEAPLRYDEVVVAESTDLRLVARCAECAYEDVKELNPELKRWITPPYVKDYILKIPYGKNDLFLANFAAVPAEQKIAWARHEVRKGETLSGLARRYNTSVKVIRKVNRLEGELIIAGRRLFIPVDTHGRTSDKGYGSRQQEIVYRVRSGETLAAIAREYNIRVSDIRAWNKGLGKKVRAGQKIKLVVNVDQI